VLELKEKLKNSPLYAEWNSNVKVPSYLKVELWDKKVEVIDLPRAEEIEVPADVLKVVEFYARA
jgi:hypothetical protein